MVKSGMSQKGKHYKVGFQHIVLFIALLVTFFFIFQYWLIPSLTANFVVPLFKPSSEQLQKIGFVKFDGLVWGSTTKDKAAKYENANAEVAKEAINKDYIFDFTFEERNEEEHGYEKPASEFYAKSPVLGEHPIILEPWVGFWILALVIALALTIFITMFLPTSIGLMAVLFDRQIDHTKVKIRLQTGFTDEIVDILTLPDDKLVERDRMEVEAVYRKVWDRTLADSEEVARQSIAFDEVFDDDTDIVSFRNQHIYNRIKEFFSEFVVKEIEDTKDGLLWRRNHTLVFKGLRLYMAHHFTEKYSNNVTGMAYGGAALLIVAVGIRGLKFIPATKPSFILLAIFLEFTMLSLLAVTLFYTEEEERMDKMLKKMEDANRSQLETLKGQQHDIHRLANALVGQTSEIIRTRVESAISEYLTSGDQVQRMVAEEISRKILIGMREEQQGSGSYNPKRPRS